MKTRIVHTKIWKDQWFSSLSKEAKLLWQYLLTNEKINISGIYELSDREIVFDTSIDTSTLPSIKQEISEKAVFMEGWVRIFNVDRYNKYRNSPLNELAYLKELSYVPADIRAFFQLPNDTSIDTSIYTLRNKKSEIIDKKKEKEFEGKKPSTWGRGNFQAAGQILKSRYKKTP